MSVPLIYHVGSDVILQAVGYSRASDEAHHEAEERAKDTGVDEDVSG